MPCRPVPGGVGIPACLAGQSQGGGYPSMPCRSVPGGVGIPACLAGQSQGGVGIPACLAGQSQGGWVSQNALQVSPGGGLQVFGGCGLVPGGLQFFGGCGLVPGGCLQFLGGLQFFGGGDTVNVQPVRIVLECILVIILFSC